MLPGEIAPFADQNIDNLTRVLDTLHPEKVEHPVTPMTEEEIYEVIIRARQAFARFKSCMADEVKQKNRYRNWCMEHGYPHS